MAKNFEKCILQKCLRINFYTYIPVNPFKFLKKHCNRCTLVDTLAVVLFLHCKDTVPKKLERNILRNETARPRSQSYIHVSVCDLYVHSQDRSAYFVAVK